MFDVVQQVVLEGVVVVGWIGDVFGWYDWNLFCVLFVVDGCVVFVVCDDEGVDLVGDFIFGLFCFVVYQFGFVVVDCYVGCKFNVVVQCCIVEQWQILVWIEYEWYFGFGEFFYVLDYFVEVVWVDDCEFDVWCVVCMVQV